MQFDQAQYAVITLLMLRGAQTPGELRARSGRLHSFEDNEEVKATLQALIDRDGGAVVARLARKPGRKDHEYAHLFSGEVESVAEDDSISEHVSFSAQKHDRIATLEARVAKLERALVALAERLGEQIDVGATGESDDEDSA